MHLSRAHICIQKPNRSQGKARKKLGCIQACKLSLDRGADGRSLATEPKIPRYEIRGTDRRDMRYAHI